MLWIDFWIMGIELKKERSNDKKNSSFLKVIISRSLMSILEKSSNQGKKTKVKSLSIQKNMMTLFQIENFKIRLFYKAGLRFQTKCNELWKSKRQSVLLNLRSIKLRPIWWQKRFDTLNHRILRMNRTSNNWQCMKSFTRWHISQSINRHLISHLHHN